MFISDKFVFVHIPKTGGTFVHKVLRNLHCPMRIQQRIHSIRHRHGISIPFFPYRYREVNKHQLRRKIPEACGALPVVLAVRNPFDHYVSHYRFNWWREFPDIWFHDSVLVVEKFGPLAEFDFAKFVAATVECGSWRERDYPAGRVNLGPTSAEWVRYLCAMPNLVLQQDSQEKLVEEVRRQMHDVTALRMESLNSDLRQFLVHNGFSENETSFLNQAKRVYPGKQTRESHDDWQSYYTPGLVQLVMEHEWMLFELFPEYRQTALVGDVVDKAKHN